MGEVVLTEAASDIQIATTEPGGRLRSSRSGSRWLPDTTIGLFGAALALLLPLLVLRVAFAPAWTPRYALLGLEAAVGVPVALALLRTRARRAAVAALCFGGVATLSTLASDNPTMAFFGMEFWGTGLLFVFALVGIWAIGTCAGERGARGIEHALLIGLAVNCAVVILEVLFDISKLGVLTINGQPAGLLGQPVALGAFLIGGAWLVGVRARDETGSRWTWAMGVVAACIELSGERLPLVLLPVALLVLLRRSDWRRAVRIVATAVIGLAVGWSMIGITAATPSASTRVGQGASGGEAGRLSNYGTALHAIADRPIFGWGPGRYQAATSQYRTEALEKVMPDGLYADAHNTPLQYAVTTGLLGLAALAAWLALGFRRATGPLAGCAALIMIVQLLQPQDVGLTPIAFLALGASALVPAPRRVVPAPLQMLAAGVALVFAGFVVVGGYREWRAYEGSSSDAFAAARMFPHWPDRVVLAESAVLGSSDGTASERVTVARQWADQAIERDRREVRSYVKAALYDIVANDLPAAQRHLDTALMLAPNSPNALVNLAALQQQQGNKSAAIATLNRVLAIEPNYGLAQQMLASLNG